MVDQAKVAIYSSGSVEAQQLLFRYSTLAISLRLSRDYFDTRIGPEVGERELQRDCGRITDRPEGAIFFSTSCASSMRRAAQALRPALSSATGMPRSRTLMATKSLRPLMGSRLLMIVIWTNPAATALNELSHAPIVRFSLLALSSIFFLVDPVRSDPFLHRHYLKCRRDQAPPHGAQSGPHLFHRAH